MIIVINYDFDIRLFPTAKKFDLKKKLKKREKNKINKKKLSILESKKIKETK